ncbi:hypothetical protein AB0395_09770 [Streptosporangium sp. NPDC051023]|uniref:hypothetical protein n=1 Tax=Streptosporangium sp. NPDC051023 TaxID=3155410 RepID=UPI00344EE7B2
MADGDGSQNQTNTKTNANDKDAGHRTAVTAALIGAGGAIIAAVIGVVAVVIGPQSGKDVGTGSAATTPASSAETSSAAAPSVTGNPATPAPTVSLPEIPRDPSAQYQGSRLLTKSGLDLDHTPPDPSWEDLLYEMRPGRGIMVGPSLVSASWSARNAPSLAQCEEALRKGWPVGHVFGHAAPGTAFCMWTNVDNVAFVRIAQEAGEEGVPVDITVWKK